LFVQFFGQFECQGVTYFVLEYVPFKDLESNLLELEKHRPGLPKNDAEDYEPVIPERDIKDILTQILDGLEVMHANGYMHRDIKPQVRASPFATNQRLMFIPLRTFLSYKKNPYGESSLQTLDLPKIWSTPQKGIAL
jgi:Protein kinase domain